jgi:PLP dependent protein
MTPNTLVDNLQEIQGRIARAAARSGRKAEEITLIGVSKTHSAAAIRQAYLAGVHHFGENRVQEWEGKRGELQDLEATWHLIGHLQSNKAARAAKLFNSIDSVDDLSVAQRLDRANAENPVGKKLRLLIEVHIGDEESKSGADEDELPALAEKILALPHVELAGLMCIPPFRENPEDARPHFAHLRKLRDDLLARLGQEFPVLSMGMSHDFEVAIEEGATEVRVGTALFGTRPPLH